MELNHKEKARELFLQGYNCSQSVFCAFAEEYGIDKDLATLCYNRYDAKPGDDHFLTVDVYTREPGTKKYHVDEKYAGMSFMEFLAEKGIHVIRICKEDANHYANNYLTINARHIMSVANQSKELAAEYEGKAVIGKYNVEEEEGDLSRTLHDAGDLEKIKIVCQ